MESLQFDEIAALVARLSPQDKVRLIEQVAATLQQDMQAVDANGWPIGFFERTYGALADDPIERPPQLPLEEREPIE